MLPYFMLLYIMLLYITLLYITLLYVTLLYVTLLYITLLYYTVLYVTFCYVMWNLIANRVTEIPSQVVYVKFRNVAGSGHLENFINPAGHLAASGV